MNLNRTAPQWQLPECELLSLVGVGGKDILNPNGSGLERYSLDRGGLLTVLLTPSSCCLILLLTDTTRDPKHAWRGSCRGPILNRYHLANL